MRFFWLWIAFLLALPSCVFAFSSSAPSTTNTESFVAASRSCKNDLCRYTTLQNALRIDSKNRDALLSMAAYYVSRGQDEPAREYINMILAADANDFDANRELMGIHLRNGNRIAAEKIARNLAALCDRKPERLLAVSSIFERLQFVDDALAMARRALEIDPTNTEAQASIIRLVERTRNGMQMRQAYEQAVRTDPNNSMVAQRLSSLHDGNKAMDRRNEPQAGKYPDLRVAWNTGKFNVQVPDSSFLVSYENAIRGASVPHEEESGATALADIRIERVGENGLAKIHIQQFFRINSQAGIRDFATRSIQYAPASEDLRIIHARVHKGTRQVIDAEDAGDEYVANRSASMYYDVRSRTLRFPLLDAGDVIELEYRIEPATNNNPYGNYFAALQLFQSSFPTRLRRFVVVTSADRKLYVALHSMPEEQVRTTADSRTYIWEAISVPALTIEPLGPPVTEFAPYVHVSTLKDTNELGLWYANLLKPQLQLDAKLQQIAKDLLAKHPEPLDRIRATYQFVLNSTHYVALEYGIYSYKPYPVTDVYARGFGDCKDKASLIIALLRATGIKADFALVRTRQMGTIVPEAASVALFNHAIVYVPDFGLWLDGTADYYGVGELPQDDQGATALTIEADGASTLRHIAVTSASQNVTSRKVVAQVQSDGTITFRGSSSTKGEDAPALRRNLEVNERQRESVLRALADVFPTVKFENVQLDSAPGDSTVDVKFGGVLDTFTGQHVLNLRNTWIQRDYLKRLAVLATRSQDLILSTPWTTVEDFAITLPEGARIEKLPAPAQMRTQFGSVQLVYSLKDQQLAIHSEVQFTATRVNSEEYAQFRAFCAAMEQSFRRDVKVVLP